MIETDISDFSVAESFVERWDSEWLAYLHSERLGQHIIPARELIRARRLRDDTASEVYHAVLAEHPTFIHRSPLHIHVPARDLRGKDVAEIGCGTGFLSRQLAPEIRSYIGIDASRLAIAIAAGCADNNCRFAHINDTAQIQMARRSCDIVVGREFFIHQNFQDAKRVLDLSAFLLRPDGRVYADFFLRSEIVSPEAVVHPAIAQRDPRFPSCGFEYTDEDLSRLADMTGFRITSDEPTPALARRFVTFELK